MPNKKKFNLNFNLSNQVNFPLLIGLMATSIGAFGGFPKTPKVMEDFLEKYPVGRWSLVYILIWQGMGENHELESILGTGATYLIWNYLNSLEEPDKSTDEGEAVLVEQN